MDYRKTPLKFFINVFIVTLLVIFFVKYFTNNLKLHDLQVYYGAAKDMLSGGQVYDKYYGLQSGYYKYAPFLLLVFSLFVWIPWNILLILFPVFTLIFVFAPFAFKLKNILNDTQIAEISIISAILFYSHPIYRDVYLGNINLILVFLFLCFLQLSLAQKTIASGICLGLIVMIKPHFFPLLCIQFLFQKYRSLIVSFLTMVVLFLCPILFLGTQKTVSLTLDWFHAIFAHNDPSRYLKTKFTLQHFFAQTFPTLATQHVEYFVRFISFITLILPISLYYFCSPKFKNKNFAYLFFMTCTAALIPNIFLTDTEHFLYGIPFVALTFYILLKSIIDNGKSKTTKLILLTFFSLFFIALPYLPKFGTFRPSSYMGLFYFSFIIFGFGFIFLKLDPAVKPRDDI